MSQDKVQKSPEVPTQREVINISGTSYFLDTLTENGMNLVKDIQTVEQELTRDQLRVNITNIAKASLITRLEGMASAFEQVPETEEAPEVSPEAKA